MPETAPGASEAAAGDAPPASPPAVTDQLVTSSHTLTTPDGELSYTARTGRLVLGEEVVTDDVFTGWQAKAEIAVTAYDLDGADKRTRPVTFVFNGGPGSASVWLHLGLLGPRRVLMGEPGATLPPPYGLADNPQTLLAASDLVFIDPMSTGHSRAVTGGKAKDYHGFGKDVEQVAELIRLWCTREDRWMSPTYLCGESYGTVRAVAVAERLFSAHALALNGLVLISSVLDYSTQDFEPHVHDRSCLNALPSYAAIAHYHGKHPGRALADVLEEAEAYTLGDYRRVLALGARLPAADRADAVATLARLTGLSETYVDRAELRIEHWRFCGELLRDRGEAVGRIDGRFTGPLASRLAESMDADPSMDALSPPYAAAMHHYLRGELGSTQDLSYDVFARGIEKWSFAEFENKPVCVTDRLERLMRACPHLAVRVEYGSYDLACPYFAAQDTIDHLQLPPAARRRLEQSYFDTGHMPYWGKPRACGRPRRSRRSSAVTPTPTLRRERCQHRAARCSTRR